MVSWLLCWLFSLLVGLFVGLLVCWSVRWSVRCLLDFFCWLVGGLVCWFDLGVFRFTKLVGLENIYQVNMM